MNNIDNFAQPSQPTGQDTQALSQEFLQAAAKINTFPASKEVFNYAVLPEFSLATLLNTDDRLESCLKRYLLIQQEFALSGKTLSPKELIIMNNVAQTFSSNIAHDDPECKKTEAEY